MKHNIGLVGCGKWSKVIISEIEHNSHFSLEGIVCKSNKDFISNSKFKIFEDYENLLKNKDIDCLYVAKSPKTNFDLVQGLNKKIPIIFEKPIADTFEKASFIYNFSLNKKIPLMTNLPNIYSDTFNEVKIFLEKNIRNISKIEITDGNYGPFRKNLNPILDWGIHAFSYIISIFENEKLYNLSHKFLKKNYEKNSYLSKFESQIKNNINISIVTGNLLKKKKRLCKIFLKNGDILINNFNTHEIFFNNKIIFKAKNSPMQNLLNKFANNIKENSFKKDAENILYSAESIKLITKFINIKNNDIY